MINANVNNMQDEFENVRCAIIKEKNKRRKTSQGIVQQEGLSPVIPAKENFL